MPATPATLWLDERGMDYKPLTYDYNKFGAEAAAEALSVPPRMMIKTLVMEDEEGNPLIILMHGDKEVSTKDLAREMDRKNVKPSSRGNAQRYTGYLVGGISPFATKHDIPIYMEETILHLPTLYINGGRRGFLLKMKPGILVEALNPTLVSVAKED
jgi:Cys-tRNA(Pro) deacylase